MSKDTLEIEGIIFENKNKIVLSDIYLKVEIGEVVGILGRNGCGKSALMKIIFGLLKTENKTIRINGESILKNYAKEIKYLPQHHFVPTHLKVKKCLALYEIMELELLEHFPEFEQYLNDKVSNLSGGFHRLLECILILLSNSKFILLDDPFTQLAPKFVDRIKELINEQKQLKGIMLTDQMHEHLTSICDRIFLLKEGKLIQISNNDELVEFGFLSG